MAADVYQGGIARGKISAQFQADYSNEGSALLYISYAQSGGANPQTSHAAVAPGGSQTVSIDAAQPGVLEVWVAVGHQEDSGRLAVASGGAVANDEAIQGPAAWGYSVA